MHRLFKVVSIFLLLLCWQMPAFAALDLVLTQGISSALPIAVLPFDGQTDPTATNNVASVISADLQNSGQFKVTSQQTMAVENVVTGQVKSLGGDQYQVTFSVSDAVKGQGQTLVSNNFTVSGNQLRPLAHHISDIIYQQLTGVRGVFSTKIAYVLVQRNPGQQPKYILEVADEDGFNPKILLTSTQPVMSPAWSHDGKRLAYVSFEKVTPQIFVQDVATGQRRAISGFPGINGAPAWSPDDNQLAVVLSKSGTPKIYVMDLAGGNLRQVTTGNAIDTEPTWTPDGKSLIFTSDRGGGPQIYRIDLNGGTAQRITFKGDYNARASIAADGKSIAMINREQGMYNIGLQDLQSGNMLVLTQSGYNSSPSLAPNGRVVLFEADNGANGVLGMVSVDGRVRVTLPAQEGSVQDPAWSPFLS